MSKKKLDIFKCFFASFTNFTIIYAMVMSCLGVTRQNIFYVPCLSLSVISFLLCLLRVYTHGFWVFFCGHGAVILGCLFIPHPNSIYRVFFVMEALVIIGYSVYAKGSRKEHSMDKPVSPPAAVVIFVIASCVHGFYGQKELLIYYPYLCLIYTVFYLFYHYIESYQNFLEKHKNTTGYIPQKEILRKSIGSICIFNFVTILVLLWLMQGNYAINFSAVGRTLLNWGVFLANRLTGDSERLPLQLEGEHIENEAAFVEGGTGFLTFLWRMLDSILDFLAPFFVLFLVILAVLGIIRIIRSIFAKKEAGVQVCSPLVTEQREKLVRKKQDRKPDRIHYFDAAGRIRYYYRKLALKGNINLPERQTARECAEKLAADKGLYEQALQFAGLYEKARYSGEICTWEDAKTAGRLYQELKKESSQQ